MKIHISLETKILLDSIGGYTLEPRGLIMVDVSLKTTLVNIFIYPLIEIYSYDYDLTEIYSTIICFD